jgi:hypothetical protein
MVQGRDGQAIDDDRLARSAQTPIFVDAGADQAAATNAASMAQARCYVGGLSASAESNQEHRHEQGDRPNHHDRKPQIVARHETSPGKSPRPPAPAAEIR